MLKLLLSRERFCYTLPNMKLVLPPLIAICLLVFSSSTAVKAQTSGVLFNVNNNADTGDATPGDRICADSLGQCTLRAAIQEANSNPAGYDVIIFAMPWPAVINLTLGELAITGNFTSIVGPGARRLSIQRSLAQGMPDFRIFHILNANTNIVIRGISIKNGRAANGLSGGGIKVVTGSTLNLADVFMIENVAQTGGGIANDGTINITRSLIDSNTATTNGGAMSNSAGSVARITNSTITGSAALTGGAVHNNGDLLFVNNTISHNFAVNNASSVFCGPNGSVKVLNTIVANDLSLTAASIQGSFISLGNNIITDARGSTGFTNGVNNDQVSDNNIINPLLGNLADNGGQTDTRALLTGSPAINAGNNCVWDANCNLPSDPFLRLFWDQRIPNLRKTGGTVDIGSIESGVNTVGGIGSLTFQMHDSPGKYLGSIIVLTNAETNEKRYAVMNLAGIFRIQSFLLPGVAYVQEIRSKRSFPISGPQIIPRFD